MDIVLSKNGVKCAVLKISDVQNIVIIYVYYNKERDNNIHNALISVK